MKILFVHNYYQIGGGEDTVVSQELDMLKEHHDVSTYFVDNSSIYSFIKKIEIALTTHYSGKSKRLFFQKLVEVKPDVVHIHNTFPLITPSILDACKQLSIPTVVTLHNYRFFCPTATLTFNNEICEKSLQGSSYWAVPKKVYRNSLIGTFVLAHMIEYHKARDTWNTRVNRFIALTEFSKSKFIEAGIHTNKLSVKPNFIADPTVDFEQTDREDYVLYVGRLSQEKGVPFLLDAWSSLPTTLKIVGDNVNSYRAPSNVEFLGLKSRDEVFDLMRKSKLLVVPSLWYEGFPMVIVEAFSCGTPVLCSDIGSLSEIVQNDINGVHFQPGNKEDFLARAAGLISSPEKLRKMSLEARSTYLQKYTQKTNCEQLMDIYHQAIAETTSNLNRKTSTLVSMKVDVINKKLALETVERLVTQRKGAYVCVSNVHMCMESFDNEKFNDIVNSADLVLPDGRPLFWAQKLLGYKNAEQVRGEDIMHSLCDVATKKGWKIGLYGGATNQLLDKVCSNLVERYPGLMINYTYSPPFRELTEREDRAVTTAIEESEVDILFVGIGCPKQEIWMSKHKAKLNCVTLGVGAAFDFIAKTKPKAPGWIQKAGLEWLFRLICEPRRLWKRYLKQNPRFAYFFMLQLFSRKDFQKHPEEI